LLAKLSLKYEEFGYWDWSRSRSRGVTLARLIDADIGDGLGALTVKSGPGPASGEMLRSTVRTLTAVNAVGVIL
jgi:hypothetical protein